MPRLTLKPRKKETELGDPDDGEAIEAEVVNDTEKQEGTLAPKKRARRKKSEPKTVSTSKELATPEQVGGLGGIEGEFGSGDLKTPWLKILQPGSDAVEELGADAIGHFIYDDAFDLGDSVTVAVTAMRKWYREQCEYDPENPPKTWRTEKEARESGLDYRDAATLDLAIQVPADSEDAEGAYFVHGDHAYLLARYNLTGRSYDAAVDIYTAHCKARRKCLWDVFYSLSAVIKPVKGKKYRKPVAASGPPIDDDLRSAIEASKSRAD